jgi:ribosomal protein L16 Arg81 hydroxylase
MSGERAALAGLLGAAGAAEFLAARWPERHHAVHRGAQALPEVLRAPALAGLDALAQRYRGAVSFGRGTRDARTASADADAAHLFRLGLSVYLPDIGACVPGLAGWLLALERELGLPAGCSRIGAFASPRGEGVSCHFDADDVVSIQLQGRKVFHIAPVAGLPYPVGQQFGPGMLPGDALYAQTGAGFPSPDDAAFERIDMAPGSVLFLPRGTWHRTEALEDSFSVSIGIRAPAALDRLLDQLRGLLLQDPQWPRPLYEANHPGRAGGELIGRVDSLLATLPAALARISGLGLVRPETQARYQRVPMARLEWRSRAARLHVTVAAWDEDWNERLTLDTEVPAHLAPALDWLQVRSPAFDGESFGERFPELPASDRVQLLDLLARAGFLRRLHFPLL